MSTYQKKTRKTQVAVFVLATGVLGAVIAGISLYAQVDPDRQLYDDDILFEQLSSGGQMRLIAKFGPKPAPRKRHWPDLHHHRYVHECGWHRGPVRDVLVPHDEG